MAGASITYKNLQEIIDGFQALPRYVGADVRDSLTPVIGDLKQALAIYPAERPGQRYQRTGALGRGWVEAKPQFIIKAAGAIDMRLSNPVSYTDLVQGERQAWMHAGRWTTAEVILTEFADDITRGVEDGVMQALRQAKLA
jgi:hypothetical protein